VYKICIVDKKFFVTPKLDKEWSFNNNIKDVTTI
jgi:hypothetical protein